MARSTEKKLTRSEVEKLIQKHLDATKFSANGKCPSCGHCNVCGHAPPRPLPWWGSPYITWEAPRWTYEWVPTPVTYTSASTTTSLGQFTFDGQTFTSSNDLKV